MELSSGRDEISYRLSALREHNWTKRSRRMFREREKRRKQWLRHMSDVGFSNFAICHSWCTCDPMLRHVNAQRKFSMRQIARESSMAVSIYQMYTIKTPPNVKEFFSNRNNSLFNHSRGHRNRTHSAAVAGPK